MGTTMKLRMLVASTVMVFAPIAFAATAATSTADEPVTQLNTTAENKGQTQVATKIASSFGKLAGSDANTLKLVQALRSGTDVTLTTTATGTGTGTGTGTTTTTTITPPTGKMGWGNVFISLALAKDALARAGITDPTTAQLQAALTGGDVVGADGKTVTLKGILTMRADGMGWGQIAQASGTKLGPVVSSIKSAHKNVAALPSSGSGGTTTTSTATTAKSSSKGMTTAAGTSSTATTAKGNSSKGVVTASGASAGNVTHGNSGNSGGKGVVTAAGGSASGTVTHGNSGNKGVGVVTAGGGSAASGVTNAGGNSGGGQAKGNSDGKGKPGG